ncbi:MAG: radical SAM protein [Myxococcales bacterium]|nr:radical SAM protein [Myxococcales bacterium]
MAECGPEAKLGTFLDHAFEKAIPLHVHWDLTWRCDHKCVHCYLTDRRQPELILPEMEGILDQLVDAGVMGLLVSGGDPFLRPDALDFLKAARARDFDVKINTHGNFIDDALADELAALGLARVSVSVYSVDPAEHEAVTLVPGSHQKTLDAARRLVARGVEVQFKTPVMVHNKVGWFGVGELAREIGAKWELDASIVNDDQLDFGLCSIGVHFSERMLAMMKGMEPHRAHVHTLESMPDAPSSARTCSAGTVSGYISPDGRLFPCINWRDPIGSLREHSFKALWYESEKIAEQRQVTRASYLDKGCGGCAFHGKCGYCPGISHAETGDPGARSPYVCERTHMTMAALEHMNRLNEAGAPVPAPGSPEAEALFDGPPTFAERQFHARKQGLARPADRLPLGLVQIVDPRR